MPQNNQPDRIKERGNVFVLILLGIVLFVTLSLSISRGMRSDTTSNLSKQEVALATSDILAYTQKIERAVSRLRRKGISENDISFEQTYVAGYNHTPAVADENKIFNADGGAISWQAPPTGSNDGSPWFFTGETCIPGVGTGGLNCMSDSTSNEELLAILPNLDESICIELNNRLSINPTPASVTSYDNTPFTGTFQDGTGLSGALMGIKTACFSSGGTFHFYYVLIEH